MASTLLAAGADPLVRNDSGKTALDYARGSKDETLVSVLQQAEEAAK
jgi:ankyrin repeat protein